MDKENCLGDVRFHLENVEKTGNQIILTPEFFHSLLKCLAIIAALLDTGKVYEAREILGELGETLYQTMKGTQSGKSGN